MMMMMMQLFIKSSVKGREIAKRGENSSRWSEQGRRRGKWWHHDKEVGAYITTFAYQPINFLTQTVSLIQSQNLQEGVKMFFNTLYKKCMSTTSQEGCYVMCMVENGLFFVKSDKMDLFFPTFALSPLWSYYLSSILDHQGRSHYFVSLALFLLVSYKSSKSYSPFWLRHIAWHGICQRVYGIAIGSQKNW